MTVDRILNQQKAEREAKRREAEKEAEKQAVERRLQLEEQAKQRNALNAALSPPPAPPRPTTTHEPTPGLEEMKPTFPQSGELTRPSRPPSIADSISGMSTRNKGERGIEHVASTILYHRLLWQLEAASVLQTRSRRFKCWRFLGTLVTQNPERF